MQYIESTFTFAQDLDSEALEIQHNLLSYHLAELGYDSFVSEEALLRAYIPGEQHNTQAVLELLTELYEDGERPLFNTQEMEDRNWNEEWERNYFQPLVIDDVTIRATFHDHVTTTPLEIIIDPKMAFGTGNHATTASMLRLIKQINPRGMRVIDMGCGSGILGIYAMKLGAQQCTSIDFDKWSVDNSRENAQLNGVSLNVLHGDASALELCPEQAADLFVANINRNIITADLAHYLKRLAPEGTLLLSGFYVDDIPVIAAVLEPYQRRIITQIEQDRWVALLCR